MTIPKNREISGIARPYARALACGLPAIDLWLRAPPCPRRGQRRLGRRSGCSVVPNMDAGSAGCQNARGIGIASNDAPTIPAQVQGMTAADAIQGIRLLDRSGLDPAICAL